MKIICIVGATGTGKNEWALNLAQIFKGEIINFDSRQIYKDFPIITAQPTEEDTKICDHHLYGFLDLEQTSSAGEFAELAEKKIKEVEKRGHIPIVVGGTGLYLRAILYGLAPIPKVPKEIREQVIMEYKKNGPEKMYKILKKIDPEYAKKIHPRDRQRITRAIEVYLSTKKPLSWYHKSFPTTKPKYSYLKLGIWVEKQKLEKKLALRIYKMLDSGGIEEVKRGWEKHPKISSPVWTSIGCKELLNYIHGKCSLQEATEKWLKNTKAYAKRQITWFKKEQDIIWFTYEGLKQAQNKVERFLNED
jgi:tRNA dimethylallyltransferase